MRRLRVFVVLLTLGLSPESIALSRVEKTTECKSFMAFSPIQGVRASSQAKKSSQQLARLNLQIKCDKIGGQKAKVHTVESVCGDPFEPREGLVCVTCQSVAVGTCF
jgi:hypothetical protein